MVNTVLFSIEEFLGIVRRSGTFTFTSSLGTYKAGWIECPRTSRMDHSVKAGVSWPYTIYTLH
jgi:hypothetical protein